MATTIAQEITELRRELRMRRQVYPGLIATGKLRNKDAEYQKACLESTIARLEELERQQTGSQAKMFDG